VADVTITIGGALLLLDAVRRTEPAPAKAAAEAGGR
jgi:hypothetical protein